jgi:hypothetical protein
VYSQVSGPQSHGVRELGSVVGVVGVTEKSVPVVKSTSVSEISRETWNSSGTRGTTVSINGVTKMSAAEDNNSAVIMSEDMKNTTQPLFNNSVGILSDNSNYSLEAMVDNLNSFSHGMDKPIVSVPRLVTRDLGNNSDLSLSTSLQISDSASHVLDQEDFDHALSMSTSLPQLEPVASRAGKSAGYLPTQFHPLVLSTFPPSQDGPDAFPLSHSSDSSDIVQSYMEGPKNNDDFINPRHVEVTVDDLAIPEHEKNGSKIIWIARTSPVSDISPEHKKMVSAMDHESRNVGIGQLDDLEMADSPYESPESSTIAASRPRIVGDSVSKPPPVSSHEFAVPLDKAVDGIDNKPSGAGPREKGQGTEILKVIPPLMPSSKVVNTSLQNVRQSSDRTKSSYIPSVDSEDVDRNASVGSVTDGPNTSTFTSETGSPSADTKSGVLAVPTSVPGLQKVGNVITATKGIEENKTTVVTILSTILPVSNGRVAAAAAATPSGPQHGLDVASITGISLGILVFAALVGKAY